MPDPVLIEEPVQFGDGGRLFGILTLPGAPSSDRRQLPVFVFLNAGRLHRVGPHRLHVRLARELAQMGFRCLRVDLAGVGDSLPRPGLTNQQSVAADHEEIVRVLESRLGRVEIVLAGLCSGADNAIRLAPGDSRVVGLVLLDPICFPDRGFRARSLFLTYTHARRYVAWIERRFGAPPAEPRAHGDAVDPLSLRDIPTLEQLRSAFRSIGERRGAVLSVFTDYALRYYNQAGQLRRVVGLDGYSQFCTELFWLEVEHTYTLDLHRRRLIDTVKTWAGDYLVRRAGDGSLPEATAGD